MAGPEPKEGDSNSYDSFYKGYKKKIQDEFGEQDQSPKLDSGMISNEYLDFKEQYMPSHFSIYEKACNLSEKILKLTPDPKKAQEIKDSTDICHLNVTPTGVVSFSILFPMLFFLTGFILSMVISVFSGGINTFFVGFFLISAVIMIFPLTNLPFILSNSWRLKTSNQMVLCIFYVVSYMRHTSNFEMAVKFTSDHLEPPLSLDLKKVLWNVETEHFESIKESFDAYLLSWRKWNNEFVEAIHIVESSLYEPTEERRVEMLEKALSLILEETYEKMLHFAQELKSPITMLHMLGIILPILGLVLLPLVVSFMEGIEWYHIAMMYNVALPIGVFYMGKMILSKRPTGYGETNLTDKNPKLKKFKNIILNAGKKEIILSPLIVCIVLSSILFLIGISPILIHAFDSSEENAFDVIITKGDKLEVINTFYQARATKFALLGYKHSKYSNEKIIGPFGIGASILSLFVTLAFGLGIGIYYKFTTKYLIVIRDKTKELEAEFAAALFQLGNRIGDGLPAELAFSKVAGLMADTPSGKFFQVVSDNITNMGFGIDKAIFDPQEGALSQYPSQLIESSMKIFVESAKKGPKIASQALINISLYIREIHKVDERLKDLMAEIISSMKTQIGFLTPAISGIVIGITSMLTSILNTLSQNITQMTSGEDGGVSMGGAGALMDMFGDGIPTFYFQIIVGLYVVQIIYILTGLVSSIQNGVDDLAEKNMLATTVTNGTMMYAAISLVIMLIFNSIAAMVLGGFSL